MATRSRRSSAGYVLLLLGVIAAVGAAAILVAPGFGIHDRTPMGQTLTVEVEDADLAVYASPEISWASVDCTGTLPDGEALGLRVSMSQQDVLVPQRWQSIGSFETGGPGTLTLTCTSTDPAAADATFALGPWVDLGHALGAVLLGVAALVLLVVGVLLGVVGRRRDRRTSIPDRSTGAP